MRKIYIVARQELRTMLRHPFYRIATVLIPVLGLLAVLGFMVFQAVKEDKGPEAAKVGYVDRAGVVTDFAEWGSITFVSYVDEEGAKAALLGGDIKRYYVIPSDYLATGQIDEYVREEGVFPSESGREALREFMLANVLAQDELAGVPEELVTRIRYPAAVSQVRLDEGGDEEPPPNPGNFAFFFVMSMLLLLALFTSAGTLLQGLGEEKENRVMEVLLSSLTPGQLMTGKILGLGTSGLLQIVIWLVAGWGILNLASGQIPAFADIAIPGASGLLGVLYFVLGYGLFGTLFACIGAITPTAREGNQFVPLFVIPAIIPFYASVVIQNNPSGLFAQVLTFFPLSSPVAVMVRLAGSAIEAWEIAISSIILVLSTLLALWVGGRIFGAYLLMYGKRPGLKEIWRAITRA